MLCIKYDSPILMYVSACNIYLISSLHPHAGNVLHDIRQGDSYRNKKQELEELGITFYTHKQPRGRQGSGSGPGPGSHSEPRGGVAAPVSVSETSAPFPLPLRTDASGHAEVFLPVPVPIPFSAPGPVLVSTDASALKS